MSDTTAWDNRLSVKPTAKNLIGHTGAALLRRLADRTGLTHALTDVLPTGNGNRWRDRAGVLIDLATAIVLGAANLSDAEALGWGRLSCWVREKTEGGGCGVGTSTGRGWRFVSGFVVAGLGAAMGLRAGRFLPCSDRGAVWGHQRPGAALNTPAPASGAAPAASTPTGPVVATAREKGITPV